MLNFNDLQPMVEKTYSFVGIAKKNDELFLHLPKGFTASAVVTYQQKRDLFFILYRVIRQFKAICVEKRDLNLAHLQMNAPDRDGLLRGNEGTTIATGTDDPLIFHAKLDWISSLLNAYDELKIAALVYRLGRTEKVDYGQLHRFMHQAVFLSNGNIYIDTMTLSRPQVQFESTDIVAMYCYLVWEVKTQLEDEVSPEVKALSEKFRQHYLGIEASLFDEQDYELVLNELKDALDKIDQHTPLKDEDYYVFYEAIERFLYGRWQQANDGEIWGINNFYMVWESMCLTYLAKTTTPEGVLWLDRQFVPNVVLERVDAAQKWFNLSDTFECNGKPLRPDVVVFPAFAPLVSATTTYYLSSSSRNDFEYCTRCSIVTFQDIEENADISFEKTIKIVYVEQPPNRHTWDELSNYYERFAELGKTLLIDHPLPEKFYSYWPIDNKNLTFQWQMMKDFNHIFYALIKQSAWKTNELKRRLSTLSRAKKSDNRPSGVFGASLFRRNNEGWKELPSWDDIQKDFASFLQQILQFQVIDIKYNDASYFQNRDNQDDIKTRSIRKQFVYEYLLQQSIQKTVGDGVPMRIDSNFWIPQVSDGAKVLLDEDPYLDGYLKLTQINFNQLINHYCNT